MMNDDTMVIDINFNKYLPVEVKKKKLPNINIILLVNIVFIVLCSTIIGMGFKYNSNIATAAALEAEKAPLLYTMINKTEQDDKIYKYTGDATENYLIYNNMLWRIIRVNSSGTITLILNDYLNINPWELENYSLQEYLNTEFKKELDVSKLTKNYFCNDTISDLNNVTCDSKDYNYVTLLDINSFIDTIDNDVTFITKNGEIMWLSNRFNEEEAWHTQGNRISHSDVASLYEVRPVITLKNTVTYESGDGTLDNPYKIASKEKLTIGSTVKIADDYYHVYSTDGNIKLVLNHNLDNKYDYSGNYLTLFAKLNEDFYNNLSYKDILIDNEWKMFNINNNVVDEQSYTFKVGMQNIFDFNTINIVDNYYLTSIDYHIIVHNNPIIYASGQGTHSVRPCIAISKDLIKDMKYEQGVYILDNV